MRVEFDSTKRDITLAQRGLDEAPDLSTQDPALGVWRMGEKPVPPEEGMAALTAARRGRPALPVKRPMLSMRVDVVSAGSPAGFGQGLADARERAAEGSRGEGAAIGAGPGAQWRRQACLHSSSSGSGASRSTSTPATSACMRWMNG